MQGIILAGGEGKRLRPLTNDKPKVMLEVSGKPVLEHNLNILIVAGIVDIIITVYYKKDVIINHFKDGSSFGLKIRYSHQNNLLGTAGDLKRINADFKSTFVLIYGDNLSNCKLKPVLEFHRESQRLATIVLFDKESNPNSQIAGGCLRIDSKSRRILEFIEGKGALTNYINAGIYILEPQVLDYIPENIFYDFGRDLFPLLLKKGKDIYGYLLPDNEYLFGIDAIECYEKISAFLKQAKRRIK